MSSTAKSKMLVILVVVLLLTNAGMLYYFTSNNQTAPKTRTQRQVDFVKRELKLDDAQLARYLQLRMQRDSIMKPMNEALRTAKMKMIGYLSQPAASVPDSLVSQAAAEIAGKQTFIEEAFYYHFRRMQAICRPEQLSLFDSMLVRMVKHSTGGDQKKDPDKK